MFEEEKSDYSIQAKRNNKFSKIIIALGRSFIRCQRDYANCFTENERVDDVGYFYNERTNIGFLAAAAWRKRGWVALEEYRYDKAHRDKSKKISKGRADLYIYTKGDNGRVATIGIEAKQVFVGKMGRLKSQLDLSNKNSALSRAYQDAKSSVKKCDADYRCAVVFTVLSVDMRKRFTETMQELYEGFYPAHDAIKLDWVSFAYFPKNDLYPTIKKNGKKIAYPAIGVTVVRLP